MYFRKKCHSFRKYVNPPLWGDTQVHRPWAYFWDWVCSSISWQVSLHRTHPQLQQHLQWSQLRPRLILLRSTLQTTLHMLWGTLLLCKFILTTQLLQPAAWDELQQCHVSNIHSGIMRQLRAKIILVDFNLSVSVLTVKQPNLISRQSFWLYSSTFMIHNYALHLTIRGIVTPGRDPSEWRECYSK